MGEQRIEHYLVMLDPLLGQTGGSLPSGLHPSHPGCHWCLLLWLGNVSFFATTLVIFVALFPSRDFTPDKPTAVKRIADLSEEEMEKIEWMEKYFPKPHQSEDRSGNEKLAATIPVSIILQANNVLEPSVMLQISRLLQVQYFPIKLFH